MRHLFGVLLIALTTCVAVSAKARNAPKPNIIFLLADDLGWFDLGCYGHPIVKTPNIDKLASQGVRLSDCYSASANCAPSRAGILTGRHPYRVGMYHHGKKPLHIPKDETSVATLLKRAGYQTFFAGKWHCSGDFYSGTQPSPGDHGFDHWYAHPKNFGRNPGGFVRNGERLGPQKGWMSEILVNEAMTWLTKRKRSKPFCAFLWFSEPHVPVIAADEFMAPYRTDAVKEKVKSLKFGGAPRKARKDGYVKYFGCVTMLDYHIGRLMDFLEKNDLAKNTIVVFTSDNGPEHRMSTSWGSPGDFRGAKGYMYEGGIRVPGIIRWPGKIKPNTWNDTPVNGTDYLPSFCALAGVPVNVTKPMDGANVMPAILGTGKVDRKFPMFWWLYYARGGKKAAMRDGDLKILAQMSPAPKNGSDMTYIREAELEDFVLYDLKNDPSEKTDIQSQRRREFSALRKRFVALHAEIRKEGPTYDLNTTGNQKTDKGNQGKKKKKKKKKR